MLDRLRPALAAPAVLVVAASVPLWLTGQHAPTVTLSALLVIAAALAFHRHVLSQLAVRATLWAHLLFASGGALYGTGDERVMATLAVGLLAAALVILGGRGLGAQDPAGTFRPVAFRGSLLVGAGISLAQAEWYSFFTTALLDEGEVHFLWFATAVGLIGLALLGLYRLQLWGLLLKSVLDLAFFGLAAVIVADKVHPITVGLLVLASVQVALTLPIWVAVLRHRAPKTTVPAGLVQAGLSFGALLATGIVGLANRSALLHWFD